MEDWLLTSHPALARFLGRFDERVLLSVAGWVRSEAASGLLESQRCRIEIAILVFFHSPERFPHDLALVIEAPESNHRAQLDCTTLSA